MYRIINVLSLLFIVLSIGYGILGVVMLAKVDAPAVQVLSFVFGLLAVALILGCISDIGKRIRNIEAMLKQRND